MVEWKWGGALGNNRNSVNGLWSPLGVAVALRKDGAVPSDGDVAADNHVVGN